MAVLCPVSLLSPITPMSLLTSPHSQIKKKKLHYEEHMGFQGIKKKKNSYNVVVVKDEQNRY